MSIELHPSTRGRGHVAVAPLPAPGYVGAIGQFGGAPFPIGLHRRASMVQFWGIVEIPGEDAWPAGIMSACGYALAYNEISIKISELLVI